MVGLVGLVLLGACSGKEQAPRSDPAPAPSPPVASAPPLLPPDTVDPRGSGPQYPGTGFRVHEWGTNTIVVGSDGSMQRGLQHEEEDLPSFVYDRRREDLQAEFDVKMETPVTYFYSDRPLTVNVGVNFPKGIFSQWYPAVQSFQPATYMGRGDPILDTAYPFSSPTCREQLSRVANGNLAWGSVDILPRGGSAPNLTEASLDRYTWSHARAVDANAVRVHTSQGTQDERFLFYRGLGNFPLDVTIAAQQGAAGRDGGLLITNRDPARPVGAVFALRVEKDKAAFVVQPAGVAPRGALLQTAPVANRPLDAYANDLAKAMVAELDKAGLYHDESVAMVKTWARQWFRTPGVRVLYLAPQAWTDAQIPLTIAPKPAELVRVMVIRVEAITPALEEADLAAVQQLGGAATQTAGGAHFTNLGRFAEPRLRRALALTTAAPPAAHELLGTLAGADVSGRAGE